ncbi:Hypothetical predicted protein [Pelobates cultripes]|uniref:Uncharacterized protein n=1 Tax=Pelobates cultripes TaxID=61616 RepID=A0AAD1T0G2_PELCU|nr:Hypothetical predicted protein [Pelobates cultripes]
MNSVWTHYSRISGRNWRRGAPAEGTTDKKRHSPSDGMKHKTGEPQRSRSAPKPQKPGRKRDSLRATDYSVTTAHYCPPRTRDQRTGEPAGLCPKGTAKAIKRRPPSRNLQQSCRGLRAPHHMEYSATTPRRPKGTIHRPQPFADWSTLTLVGKSTHHHFWRRHLTDSGSGLRDSRGTEANCLVPANLPTIRPYFIVNVYDFSLTDTPSKP